MELLTAPLVETETTVVTLPATPVQEMLNEMLRDVRAGRWCKGQTDDGMGHYCTAGLAQKALGLPIARG